MKPILSEINADDRGRVGHLFLLVAAIVEEEGQTIPLRRGLLRERASDTFALIHARKAIYPIATMCAVLGVSTAGYYAWCRRPPSRHAQRDQQLRVLVHASFTASKGRYGSPRIHRDLREDHQQRVSRKRVIRLMQVEGLKARVRKRFTCTTMSAHD